MLNRLAPLLRIGSIAALIASAILPAGAEEAAVSEDNTPPPLLMQYLVVSSRHQDIFRENYLQMVMRDFRGFAGEDQVLDSSDIDLLIAASRAGYRAAIVNRIMRNDLNADGIVTGEELRRVNVIFPNGDSSRIDGLVRGYLAADEDDDGSISTEEADSFASRRELPDDAPSWHRVAAERQLITLDSDGDGRLMANELDAAARGAFAHFDRDGDGRLVEAEIPLRSETYPWLSEPDGVLAKCAFPKLSKDARLVFLFGPDSDTLSDVSVAGPDVETHAQKLVVRDGDKPIDVVALSGASLVWQVTGSIGRVERFVATSRRVGDTRRGSGVAGLDPGKVSFVDAVCYGSPYGGDPFTVLGPVIRRLLGRDADEIILGPHGARIRMAYSENKAITVLSDGAITFVSDPPKRFEEYSSRVDRKTYDDFVKFSPGGIAHLDPAKVISEGSVQAYTVLPQEAGLLQLLDNGSLLRSRSTFRIVKPIDRFPPGLNGAHAADGLEFALAKGIPMPKGDPGHACVVSEETDEVLVCAGTKRDIDPFADLRSGEGRY